MSDISEIHAIDRSKYHIPGVFSVYNVTIAGPGVSLCDAVERLFSMLDENPLVDRDSMIFVFNARGGAHVGFTFTDGDRPSDHDDIHLWSIEK